MKLLSCCRCRSFSLVNQMMEKKNMCARALSQIYNLFICSFDGKKWFDLYNIFISSFIRQLRARREKKRIKERSKQTNYWKRSWKHQMTFGGYFFSHSIIWNSEEPLQRITMKMISNNFLQTVIKLSCVFGLIASHRVDTKIVFSVMFFFVCRKESPKSNETNYTRTDVFVLLRNYTNSTDWFARGDSVRVYIFKCKLRVFCMLIIANKWNYRSVSKHSKENERMNEINTKISVIVI